MPGRRIIELAQNDRIVGGINKIATKKTVKFYYTFVSGEVMATDSQTAEMARLTENSFSYVNVEFANVSGM